MPLNTFRARRGNLYANWLRRNEQATDEPFESVLFRLCDVREEGDGGGTGANDDYVFVGVIVLGVPKLRMHDLTLKLVQTRDDGLQRLVVVIIPGTEHEELAAVKDQLALSTLWWKLIFLSMPYMAADSFMYLMMRGPSAIEDCSFHGRHEKPNVYRSYDSCPMVKLAQVRAFFLQSVCEVDSRNSRADNDHVVIVYGLPGSHDVGGSPRVRDG
ncbi:hypothetical protein KC327_g21 [Hortaea werneckii]|nr:hypothetical protein KC327_g21 [Hortaea werneckii]